MTSVELNSSTLSAFQLEKLKNGHTKIATINLAVSPEPFSIGSLVNLPGRAYVKPRSKIKYEASAIMAFTDWMHAVKVSSVSLDCPDTFDCSNIARTFSDNVLVQLYEPFAFTMRGVHSSSFF